jgi:hypothetical protein
MSKSDVYTIVIARMGGSGGSRFKPWGWEIYRSRQPLPVRVFEAGFKTEHTARLAGNVALRDFLIGLAQEQSKTD